MNDVQEQNEQRSRIELLNDDMLDASFARPGLQENNGTLDKLSIFRRMELHQPAANGYQSSRSHASGW
ncbi:hypothetical protein EOA27_26545 [Mesorhizobium sp. M2A.F.Ca.ET.037.01.1.1]|uniref:hypothetical protein n=1 Tax=unclassified Mesorhizobium TaxID=325217 RepID=UPI000F761718|nr:MULTISPECIES: hypothetical protein [unclassified Mesorhizobium]RUY09153.1 hypothetical protein EOA25_12120 [Mesorhizobium sp. M2A.F.Ca.ET.040.01.1.1]RVC67593.1 hypothetical protein EN759_14785 [Mesorhizobium sp. M00.F.Ca.ET.038.03.1.1]RVC68459.1 hypothetical protein EN766_30350 [Mesorhizobium sp. M2A.F.Ca.ET.046.02.1.1]AZO05802.1 hypothetical protein EJ068_24110 [Mesorhizobium sp. M2A.F.Ca.ET.043.02.1.1]AZO33816.1 hypothetical protein EJ072_04235 [Mesorhizobium sp. M2A.F.Ca.ET.046.03.2.1]